MKLVKQKLQKREKPRTTSLLQTLWILLLIYTRMANGTSIAPSIDPEEIGDKFVGSIDHDPLLVEARRVAAVVDASLKDTCMLQILARLSDSGDSGDSGDDRRPPIPYDTLVQRVAADLTTCLVPHAGGSACQDPDAPIDACIEALRAEPPAWIAFTSFLSTADAHVHRHTEDHRRVASLNAYREALERLAGNLRHVEEVLKATAAKDTEGNTSSDITNNNNNNNNNTQIYYLAGAVVLVVVILVLVHRGVGETVVLSRATAFLVGSAVAAVALRALRRVTWLEHTTTEDLS